MFSDHSSGNWRVEVVSCRPFFASQTISLCVVERDCSSSAVPCVYFPEAGNGASIENSKTWSLDMRHLSYPEKEVTLIFCFHGKLEKYSDVKLEKWMK